MKFMFVPIAFLFITSGTTPAFAAPAVDLTDVGVVDLENDGAPEAQQAFLHGLAQLHNFEFDAAAADFREAQRLDPDFALAYWGEAMSYNHPIWMEQDREAALAALARFAPTPAERREKLSAELARDLFRSLNILYGDGDKEARDDRYMAFMAKLHDKYPDNVDVAAFYALSLMGTAHEGRDFATYMKAAAVMLDFFVDYPQHPGVAHYLIHASDDPVHAPLGLRAANAYADIAPNAAHAQHMTTHIFLALGDWDGVIRANTRAAEIINDARAGRGEQPSGCGHYTSWLMYGHLQQADVEAALEIMRTCYREIDDDSSPRVAHHYAWQRALYLFDTADWQGEVADMQVDLGDHHHAQFENYVTDAWIVLARDDVEAANAALEKARASLEQVKERWDSVGVSQDDPSRLEPEVQLLQVEAKIALANGRTEAGVALLRDAVAMELELPFGFGPPSPAKPSLELLGETLLLQGRYAEAIETLQANLKRTPNKLASVAALATAEAKLAAAASAAAR